MAWKTVLPFQEFSFQPAGKISHLSQFTKRLQHNVRGLTFLGGCCKM
jgi:hypothetical protein